MTKPIVNRYCVGKGEKVVPWSCECCKRCWLYVDGRPVNRCPWGGPFTGYEKVETAR